MTAFAYIAAALAEIAGCFAFWAWLRRQAGVVARPRHGFAGAVRLSAHAGRCRPCISRAYAAYGGVYIVAALLWLWAVEGVNPTAGT